MVLREIGNVLEEYLEHPYQTAFSIYEFRQKLIAPLTLHSHHNPKSGDRITIQNRVNEPEPGEQIRTG